MDYGDELDVNEIVFRLVFLSTYILTGLIYLSNSSPPLKAG